MSDKTCGDCGHQKMECQCIVFDTRQNIELIRKWISVKDRLPQNRQRVLVCNKDENYPIVSRYRDLSLDENCGYDEWLSPAGECKVTHWMPLPEPPK